MNVHVDASATTLTLANARIVLEDAVIEGGALMVRGGVIEAIEPERTGRAIDCGGDVVMPGLVDVHTDHFEKHVYPRPHVRWDALSAALSHDAQVIGAGVTTVFDSLGVGLADGDADRRTILAPMLDALNEARAAGALKADHKVHLRCELSDEATPGLLDENLGRSNVSVASLMDHSPGVRQTRDLSAHVERRAIASGRPVEAVAQEIAELKARLSGVAVRIRAPVLERLRPLGVPLMSHDDGSVADVAEAVEDGIAIAEFPTTLEAAREARRRGMVIVAGAPNYVRGGSQSGNVAVRDLLGEGLVDVFASDYVPRSMLDALFKLAADPDLATDLAQAARTVTLAPARAARLTDRGAIAVGQRADLVRIGTAGGQPFVRAVWRAGERVA